MSETKKVSLLTIIVIIVAGVLGSIGGRYGYDYIVQQGYFGTLDSELAAAASEVNANLPMMVDFMTRLDNVMTAPPRKFIYYYTLTGDQAASVNEDLLVRKVRPQSIKHYKNSEEMEMFREKNVELVYVYRNENGDEIGRFEVSPADFED